MQFKNTRLWKNFANAVGEHKSLIDVFDQTHAKAAVLTNETRNILTDFTVHDVNHLDALWSVADEVMGDNIKLNPLETFILGCAFLFHDAGMALAAYPKGMDEIQKSQEWKQLLRRNGHQRKPRNKSEIRRLLEIFLREQHAQRAETLPSLEWPTSEGTFALMADEAHRTNFGVLIGKIAASHHWSQDRIEKELNEKSLSSHGYPREWQIDSLKLACILRCADAANIDQSRAPAFLWALQQGSINVESNMHWTFQTRMKPAVCEGDALRYESIKPYSRDEAKLWWMAYDTMAMVDKELRSCDQLLARARGDDARMAARRVLDIDSPQSVIKQIGVTGWSPVDTSFTINDIPKLVEKLGGVQLYGDNHFVAVRELIMNGMDAVRVRRKVEARELADKAVSITLNGKAGKQTLTIADEGVGLDQAGFVKNLLGFGSSGWLNDPAFNSQRATMLNEEEVYGQFGIGFFSVFMLGSKVKVTSRRFDSRPDETMVLEFQDGLKERPIIYTAAELDQLHEPGTTIQIELAKDAESILDDKDKMLGIDFYYLGTKDYIQRLGVGDVFGMIFPTSDVLLNFDIDETSGQIDGRAWQTEEAVSFLERCHPGIGKLYRKDAITAATKELRDAKGVVVGRTCLLRPVDLEEGLSAEEKNVLMRLADNGALVCRGAVLERNLEVAGVINGFPTKAARDGATPVKNIVNFKDVLIAQIDRLVALDDCDDRMKQTCAETLAQLGQDDRDLPRVCISGEYLNKEELFDFCRQKGEVWVTGYHDLDVANFVDMDWGDPRLCTDRWNPISAFASRSQVPSEYDLFQDAYSLTTPDRIAGLLELQWWNDGYSYQSVRRHIMKDVHGKMHTASVTILRPNMTEQEFLALHAEDDTTEKD